jgi:hypothetical protein
LVFFSGFGFRFWFFFGLDDLVFLGFIILGRLHQLVTTRVRNVTWNLIFL